MCKLCKKLREIKDLDENRYLKIIRTWRQRDYKARKLMSRLLDVLFDDPSLSEYNRDCIIAEVLNFIHSSWTGK